MILSSFVLIASTLMTLPVARAPFAASCDESSSPKYENVDFWKDDALEVPIPPSSNLMVNGSFEQRWKGWHWFGWGGARYEAPADGIVRHTIVDGGVVGRKVLRLRKTQLSTWSLISASVPTAAGETYTLSWYAKGAGRKSLHSVQPLSAGRKGKFPWMGKIEWTEVDGDWRRFEKTFVADGEGVAIQVMNGSSEVLIDGMQLEKGKTAGPYAEDPVVGAFLTSSPDNDLRPDEDMDARLRLWSKDGARGGVRVRIKNFYSEIVYEGKFPLEMVADGTQEIPIPLNGSELGTGVFVVQLAYGVRETTGVRRWRDYQRFSISRPLANEHPTATFFCSGPYGGWFSRTERGADIARKMKEWGFGSLTAGGVGNAVYNLQPDTVRLCRENKLKLELHPLAYEFNAEIADLKAKLKRPEDVTDEVLDWWEKAAYEKARDAAPDDDLWTFGNEEETWVRSGIGFEAHFKLLQACRRGFERAFAERGLKVRLAESHGTQCYTKTRHWDSMDAYLETAARHGFRYDAIGVHFYGNLDKSIFAAGDADEEMAHLLERMKHYGYPDTTPVYQSECFNILPRHIPEWGADSWTDGSNCGSPSQDLGHREFVHAGAMARQYLIALKYWPRVRQVNTWQNINCTFLDLNLTPFMWLKMVNTLGHLLPDPRFVGDVRPFANVRAYAFRQSDKVVLALWTNDNDVELGRKRGPVLSARLPTSARFVDLMGNERRARRDAAGHAVMPLSPAPLFVMASELEADALLGAIRECDIDDPSVAISGDIYPKADGSIELSMVNLTQRSQRTELGVLAPKERRRVALSGPCPVAPMRMQSFSTNFLFLARPCALSWFAIPRCGDMPDWSKVEPLPIVHEVRRERFKRIGMRANVRAAWNPEKLFLRVEVEDETPLREEDYGRIIPTELWRYDGCLEVYLDAYADARCRRTEGFDENDMRFDFVFGRVWRQLAVNWQLAQGTASATDEEIVRNLEQRRIPCGEGRYAYEIAIAARYLAPIELKAGTRAALGLFIHDRDEIGQTSEGGLSFATEPWKSCNGRPHLWPEFILVEETAKK